MLLSLSGFSKDTVYLIGIPITHNFSTIGPGFQGIIMIGGKLVISPSPVPDVVLPLIEREGVTAAPAVPAMVISWMAYPELKKYNISSLRLVQVGGSKLNAEVAREIGPKLGANVQQIFGTAEGPCFFTRLDDPEEIKFNTQGRPISAGDEFKIVDPDSGSEVPPGKVGEVWCRGPYCIRGYYNAPEHNA
jgi:non-ribosomal peptide synthetase component E (peptide arylation enzyme)